MKVSQVHQGSVSQVHQRIVSYQKVTSCYTFKSNDSAGLRNDLITDTCNFTNYTISLFCGRDGTAQGRIQVGKCSVAMLCVVLVAIVVKVMS